MKHTEKMRMQMKRKYEEEKKRVKKKEKEFRYPIREINKHLVGAEFKGFLQCIPVGSKERAPWREISNSNLFTFRVSKARTKNGNIEFKTPRGWVRPDVAYRFEFVDGLGDFEYTHLVPKTIATRKYALVMKYTAHYAFDVDASSLSDAKVKAVNTNFSSNFRPGVFTGLINDEEFELVEVDGCASAFKLDHTGNDLDENDE